MSETLLFVLIALICILIGVFLGNLITRLKQRGETSALQERIKQIQLNEQRFISEYESKIKEYAERASLQEEKFSVQFENVVAEREDIRKEKDLLNVELTKRTGIVENLENKLKEERQEVEKLQEKFTKEFENLANKILENKSEKFTKQNKENIDIILKPLQEKIEKFEKKVEETNKEAIDRTSALREQIKGLTMLNEQMTKEAHNLTKALKGDSKVQGNWGELVLEKVLEKSGLEKDREYFVQNSFTTETGQRQLPDVVIHLPDNKRMIIDSKVSLVAYERYVNEDDTTIKDQHLKDHLASLRKHVSDLSAKNYQDIYEMESPDFVLLFVPIEPAFAIAINNDNTLYNKAFEQNIIIVTPSTLLATLRTIDTMWNNEKQQQNALEIAKQAGRLYDQFVNLTDDLLKVGNQLKTVQGSYDTTMKKLTGQGNLIRKVEAIKKLGIKQKKHIDERLLKRALNDENDDTTS